MLAGSVRLVSELQEHEAFVQHVHERHEQGDKLPVALVQGIGCAAAAGRLLRPGPLVAPLQPPAAAGARVACALTTCPAWPLACRWLVEEDPAFCAHPAALQLLRGPPHPQRRRREGPISAYGTSHQQAASLALASYALLSSDATPPGDAGECDTEAGPDGLELWLDPCPVLTRLVDWDSAMVPLLGWKPWTWAPQLLQLLQAHLRLLRRGFRDHLGFLSGASQLACFRRQVFLWPHTPMQRTELWQLLGSSHACEELKHAVALVLHYNSFLNSSKHSSKQRVMGALCCSAEVASSLGSMLLKAALALEGQQEQQRRGQCGAADKPGQQQQGQQQPDVREQRDQQCKARAAGSAPAEPVAAGLLDCDRESCLAAAWCLWRLLVVERGTEEARTAMLASSWLAPALQAMLGLQQERAVQQIVLDLLALLVGEGCPRITELFIAGGTGSAAAGLVGLLRQRSREVEEASPPVNDGEGAGSGEAAVRCTYAVCLQQAKTVLRLLRLLVAGSAEAQLAVASLPGAAPALMRLLGQAELADEAAETLAALQLDSGEARALLLGAGRGVSISIIGPVG